MVCELSLIFFPVWAVSLGIWREELYVNYLIIDMNMFMYQQRLLLNFIVFLLSSFLSAYLVNKAPCQITISFFLLSFMQHVKHGQDQSDGLPDNFIPPALKKLHLPGIPQALEIMENLENHLKKFHAWKNHGIRKS